MARERNAKRVSGKAKPAGKAKSTGKIKAAAARKAPARRSAARHQATHLTSRSSAWLRQYNITHLVLDSANQFFGNIKLLLLAALSDILFLFGFSLTLMVLQMRAFDHAYHMILALTESTGGLMAAAQDPFSVGATSWMADPTFRMHLEQVIYHFLLMFIMILILWCVFQGISWWLAHKISASQGKTRAQALVSYLGNFTVSSVLFFLITLALLSYFLKLYIDVGLTLDAQFTRDIVYGVYVICLIIVWYFAFMSYSLGIGNLLKNLKMSITLGAKRIVMMLPTIIFIFLFYAILLELWTLLLNVSNTMISVFFGLVIFLPSITFSRVLFIKAAQRLKSRQDTQ